MMPLQYLTKDCKSLVKQKGLSRVIRQNNLKTATSFPLLSIRLPVASTDALGICRWCEFITVMDDKPLLKL